jgi:hypothetical protein
LSFGLSGHDTKTPASVSLFLINRRRTFYAIPAKTYANR